MRVQFHWFTQAGKHRISAESEVNALAYRRFVTSGYVAALHIAILAQSQYLPGLQSRFTDLAVTLIPENGPPHHLAAGSFAR